MIYQKIIFVTFFMLLSACNYENSLDETFSENKAKFNSIVQYTLNSNLINDSLNANGDYIWIIDNNLPHYFSDSIILKYCKDLLIKRIEVSKYFATQKENHLIFFYFDDKSNLLWRSNEEIVMPLRYTIKRKMSDNWFFVSSD